MDLVLSAADYYFFTPYVYPATWPEDNIIRQTISLLIVTNLGAYILYFFCATLSYYFVYDHSLMKHPQFLKNQVSREIVFTVKSLPWISIPTVSLFLLELRGYSKLYDDIGDFPNGWIHLMVSVVSFLFFTDMLIYWTISIHDGDFRVPQILRPFINGSAHHTDHHMFFDYNYGQYFTLWDRIGGSFKHPSSFEGKGPHSYVKNMTEKESNSFAENGCKGKKVGNGEFTKNK